MTEAHPAQIPTQLTLSHVGIYVRDLDRMVEFYRHMLGFIVSDRAVARKYETAFLTRTPGAHHELVLSAGRPEGAGPEHAAQQISFKAAALNDLRAMQARAGEQEASGGVTDIYAVDHGNAYSLYFRDPEENRIEIYLDTPWHVSQPHHEKLDLTRSDAEILTATEQRIRTDPSFMTAEEYANRQREELAASGE
jgi:catechol 2,3-dioxygenase